MISGQQLLRAVKPEAVLKIDGKDINVGGLYGQKENAYLKPEWVDNFVHHENDFQFVKYTISEIQPLINWNATGWAMNKKQPTGKTLNFFYQSNIPALKDL